MNWNGKLTKIFSVFLDSAEFYHFLISGISKISLYFAPVCNFTWFIYHQEVVCLNQKTLSKSFAI